MPARFVAVAKADEIAEGETLACQIDGLEVLVGKYDGQFFAVENECSHALATFDGCRLEGNILRCPAHGAEFDITNGMTSDSWVPDPLRTFEVRERNGMVEVKI